MKTLVLVSTLLLTAFSVTAQPFRAGYMTTNTPLVQINPRISSLLVTNDITSGGDFIFLIDESVSFGDVVAAPLEVWGWRHYLRSESNPEYIALQAPAMAPGTAYSVTFPDTAGFADSVLLNNGFGTLTWLALRHTDTNPAFYGAVTMSADSMTWKTNLVAEGKDGAWGTYTATNAISVTNGARQVILMTNNWLFLNATNLDVAAGASQTDLEVQIHPQHFWIATNRTIVLNNTWRRFSGAITNTISSNKLAILRLRRAGGVNSTVWASWEPEL